jgi:hypothetical protein
MRKVGELGGAVVMSIESLIAPAVGYGRADWKETFARVPGPMVSYN